MSKRNKTSETGKQKEELLINVPERMDIRVDWAFRHFFRKKKHLIKIIRDLLDIDMEIIEYLPEALDVATEQDKKSVFDVVCKNTKTEETFVLEMQTTYESDMADRLYYYGGSLIHNQVSSGDKKYVVNSVLICCIASYNVPHKQPVPQGKVLFRYKMMENDTHEVYDDDKLNICFLELNRFDNYLDKDADLKKQWCWIFNNLANFAKRPENLDPSFDDVIKDAGTGKLTIQQKIEYMVAMHLNDRERLVIHEGGVMIGREEVREEWRQDRIEKVKPRPKVDVEWVDLGLSVSWAACNLNATVPEASGSYFSWGEILPKSDYSWDRYRYGDYEAYYDIPDVSGAFDFFKYDQSNGFGNTYHIFLESGDDAVTQKLGQPCRLPTMAEVQELIENCVWTQTVSNGVSGYTVTGKNGNSIFLPAAGYMDGQKLKKSGEYGLLWTSELDSDTISNACDLYFNCRNNKVDKNDSSLRCYGFPVRPVK